MEQDTPTPESFSDEQIAMLKQVFTHQIYPVIDQPQYNSATNIFMPLLEIAQQLGIWDCIGFERAFRETNSRIYLLADPRNPEGTISSHPLTREELPFALYICVNGPDEARETLELWGITEEENQENLKSAGILSAVDMEQVEQEMETNPNFDPVQPDNENPDRFFSSGGDSSLGSN